MFSHLTIHLKKAFCKHWDGPGCNGYGWALETSGPENQPGIWLRVHCKSCDAREYIPYDGMGATVTVDLSLTEQAECIGEQDDDVSAPEPQQPMRVTFERGFTTFDRKLCEKMGIVYEGPPVSDHFSKPR